MSCHFLRVTPVFVTASLLFLLNVLAKAEPETKSPSKGATIEALREFNGLIGSWRGIGQVKRGSTEGSWQEKADLVWELKPKSTGIRINVDEGKEWKTALLAYDEAGKVLRSPQICLISRLENTRERFLKRDWFWKGPTRTRMYTGSP